MNLALVAETAPAKTMIPILKHVDADILTLTHSEGAMDLLGPYSTEIKSIGHGRNNPLKKNSDRVIATRVLKDTIHTYNSLKNKNIDLVMTCGNAGDVRKGITAAKLLKIPRLHIEQDIYNPIEMIAYADLITTPTKAFKKTLKKRYGITNVVNIRGYPQAQYVSEVKIVDPDTIYKDYHMDDFYVLVLGGDTRPMDIPDIINQVQRLNKTILIVPFRFTPKFVRQYVTRESVYIIDGFIDLISLMNASQGVIYCAGMGITIEVGALSVPSVKILGFHTEHASIDLAHSLGINVVSAFDIVDAVNRMKPPRGKHLVNNGNKASYKVAELINNLDVFEGKQGGRKSMKKIWNERKKYR
jgi:UDP-N-acetylglucosamine:LPS N-acetylglucosamine transferase